MPTPGQMSLEQRVAALENGRTDSTAQRSSAAPGMPTAVKVIVPCTASVGQVVRLFDEEWFLADSTQPERALVGVVSRVVRASPATCEVVLWGTRYAVGTPGTFYYMSAEPGVLSTVPPTIGTGTDDEEATEEWTHIVEIQCTPNLRIVRPDAWKRRVQRVQVCELIEGVDTPTDRVICELTDEPAPE